MSDRISEILTEGLVNGYAGKGEITGTTRGDTFVGKVSHSLVNGGVYHDEWFVPNYLGGGQELVDVNGQMFTRLYGGGTPAPYELAKLGLTAKDVGRYLKRKIIELGSNTS